MGLSTQTEQALLRINQSKVKRLSDTVVCPQKYYLEEVTGDLKREATDAMNAGHYFEYKLWGTLPKEGNIPQPKAGRKKGSISLVYERINQQVADFPKWMAHYGIRIIKTNVTVEVVFANGIIIFGTCDALVEYKGQPYIFDLKLTADVNSTFGKFAWGNFKTLQNPKILIMNPNAKGVYTHVQTIEHNGQEMDILQSHYYMHMLEKKTGKPWGFLYGVFDYKASGPDHKIIEIPRDLEAQETMATRILDTKHKLNVFKELNYMPIPSEWECKACKAENCAKRWVSEEPESEPKSILTSPVQEVKVVYQDEAPW